MIIFDCQCLKETVTKLL